MLIENKDTIGFFLIIMDPHQNKLLKPWSDEIFRQQVQENTKSKNRLLSMSPPVLDNGITGMFRGKNFSLISNGTTGELCVLLDNQYMCMFKSNPDYSGMSKKERIIPHLLIRKDIPVQSRPDLFRLAVMSRFMRNSLR